MTDFTAATVSLSASDAQPSPDAPGYTGGVPQGADGQVLSWLSSIPVPVDPKNLNVVTPNGAASRTLGARFGEIRSLLDLPAAHNDGTLIDVPTLESQFVANTRYYAPEGLYLLSETLTIPTAGTIIVGSQAAIFKIVDNATPRTLVSGNQTMLTISPICLCTAGTGLSGVTIDGNRDNQNKTLWNGYASPGFTVHGYGVEAGLYGTPLSGIVIDICAQNCITQAVRTQNLVSPSIDIIATNCGGLYRGWQCTNEDFGYLRGSSINIAGFKQGIQAVDIRGSRGVTRMEGFDITDQWGDNDQTIDSFLSGFTAVDVECLYCGSCSLTAASLTGMNGGLAYSFIGIGSGKVGLLKAYGYPNQMLELASSNIEFDWLLFDAAGAIPYLPIGQSQYGAGISIYDNPTYFSLPFTSQRADKVPSGVKIGGGFIKNCFYAALIIDAAQDITVKNLSTPGNNNGLVLQQKPISTLFHGFAGRPGVVPKRFLFEDCDFSGNLTDNVRMLDGVDVSFVNCKFLDAGQNSTRTPVPGIGTTSNGLSVLVSNYVSPTNKTGLQLINCEDGDTQDWTDGWLSYDPGTPLVCSSNVSSRIRTGQTLSVGKATPLVVVRYHISGTRSGGTSTKPLLSIHAPLGNLPAAKQGQTWETDVYVALISATANIGNLILKLNEDAVGGVVVQSTSSSAINSPSLTLETLTRAFTDGTTVAASVQITTDGNITDGSTWDVVFDVSYPLLFQQGHAYSTQNNGGGTVGIIGSGGVYPNAVSYSGPSGTSTVEIVSITTNGGFTQAKDFIVTDNSWADEFTVAAGADVVNLVVGTGTISTNGTTMTGTGTAFLSEIDGRVWIGVGGVYRQAGWVTDDTDGGLANPFPSNLTNQPFVMVKHPLSGKPSQVTGINFGTTQVISPTLIAPRHSGNLSADVVAVDGVTVVTVP